MKILYVTDYIDIARHSGGFISDYLNDTLYHGLHELLDNNVIDSTPIISLYKNYEPVVDKKCLWGGFSTFFLIEKDEKQNLRKGIPNAIARREYDYIIYGAARRCLQYYDTVRTYYPPDRIIMIDGNDDTDILTHLSDIHPYFKREINTDKLPANVFPISFSFPESKILCPNLQKSQKYATVIPGDSSTYIFKNEKSYYEDYNKSYFGVTMKKAGWDCMRHYEILGSYCMPDFLHIDDVPIHTLTTLPLHVIRRASKLLSSFDEKEYYHLMNEAFTIFKEQCTTKAMAAKVLSTIISNTYSTIKTIIQVG